MHIVTIITHADMQEPLLVWEDHHMSHVHIHHLCGAKDCGMFALQVMPAASYSPEESVRVQLDSLSKNDEPW